MAGEGEIVSYLAETNSGAGLHVFVTHDYLVGATARYCLGEKLSDETWPGFLECVVLWQETMVSASGIREGKDIFPGDGLRTLSDSPLPAGAGRPGW